MNRSLTFFGILVVLAESALCVPIPVEEVSVVEPELRGFIDSILSALFQPIADNGIVPTGDELITSLINTGGNLLNSLVAAPDPNNPSETMINSDPEVNTQPMIVQPDDQMLDMLDVLLDQMILDQPIGTTETIGNGERGSQGEIGDVSGTPLYMVIMP